MADRKHLSLVPAVGTHATPVQSCFDCENAMFGPKGTYCTAFGEEIFSETTAADDCPEFEATS